MGFDVYRVLGSVLLGGLLAFFFSGMVTAQCIVYFKMYPEDSLFKKAMVTFVWLLDLIHSTLICFSLFYWFIYLFTRDKSLIAVFHWSLPVSFFVTGTQTVITNSYFAHKIHRSGGSNWWISSPIIVLLIARLGIVSFATTELLISKNFKNFLESDFEWSFTAGLSISAGIDVLIAGWMLYFLRRMRRRLESSVMRTIVDSLTRFTMESGFLCCFATLATLLTWLLLQKTFVAIGLHFLLAKLYINSLLASLNTRKELRELREQSEEASLQPPVFSPEDFASLGHRHPAAIVNPLDVHLSSRRKPKLEIRVKKQTQTVDSLGSLSDMMYPRTAPLVRPTVMEWRSGSYRSMSSLTSANTADSR